MRQKLSSLWLRIKQNITQPRPYLIQEKISLWIATPFLFFTLTQYISVAIQKPFNDFVGLCFSSIGLTLALSALCGQIASVTNKEDKFHTVLTYAGEKFLHSSLLLTQTSVLMFVKDYLVNSGSISVTIKKSVSLLSNGTAGLCAAQAALLWHWGFSALNSALWSRP